MGKTSKTPPTRLAKEEAIERLVDAATKLIAEKGPSEVKARSVAEAAQVSTIAVYYHLGGITELFQAVVDKGFRDLDKAFDAVDFTDDPVADLFAMALATRELAQGNPHLYDLMFGLSKRGSLRPAQSPTPAPNRHSEAFQAAYKHLVRACTRLVDTGRVRDGEDPEAVANLLWSGVHGFVTLELGDHFAQFEDPPRDVLLPLTVNILVGLGDDAKRCRASEAAALSTSRGGTARRKARSRTARAGADISAQDAPSVSGKPSAF
jgi:AcrR family transcriptional regulator